MYSAWLSGLELVSLEFWSLLAYESVCGELSAVFSPNSGALVLLLASSSSSAFNFGDEYSTLSISERIGILLMKAAR